MTTNHTRKYRRAARVAAFGLAVGLFAAACGSDKASTTASSAATTSAASAAPTVPVSSGGAPTETTSLTFQTSWIPLVQFGGSYLAQENGHYADEGLDVKILPGGPETDVIASLVAGDADIAVSNADNVARANSKGADLVVVGAGFQRNPLAVLSSSSNPINTPMDMYGKKIGVPAGDTAAHDALIEFQKLDKSQITVVPVGFDVAPLVSGEVDGLYVFYTEQPIAFEAAGKTATTFLLADYGFDVYAQVYTVTRDFLTNHRDLVEAFMRSEIRGWQDYVADPAQAVDLTVNKYAKDAGLSVDVQTKQAARQLDLLVTDDTKSHGLFWMTDAGIKANIAAITGIGIEGVDASMFDQTVLSDIYKGESSLAPTDG